MYMDMDSVETLSNNTPKLLTNSMKNPDINLESSPSLNKSPSSSILFYIGLVLLLIGLGFFIFKYLGDISAAINNLVSTILLYFGQTAKQTVNISAEGSKGIIDAVSSTSTAAINLLENKPDKAINNTNNNGFQPSNSTLDANINSNANSNTNSNIAISNSILSKQNSDDPDPYTSEITGKSGYCFVGMDNNVRSCVNVSSSDKCMSGNIFPSMELCVNPSLRG